MENDLIVAKLFRTPTVQLPPTPARVFCVAANLAEWTPEEEVWLNDNPAWFMRELTLRQAIADHEAAAVLEYYI